jgi:hypothetical protein
MSGMGFLASFCIGSARSGFEMLYQRY